MTIDKKKAEDSIRTLLESIGEDPNREGLLKTPSRVIKMFDSFFYGYNESASEVLIPLQEDDFPKFPVIIRDIDFVSYCEHHIAPMEGKIHIGYIPGKHLVGLSKIVQCVGIVCAKLQLQERIASEIAQAMEDSLNPLGIAVSISARHHCMKHKSSHSSKTLVSERRGEYEKEDVFNNFLMQIQKQ